MSKIGFIGLGCEKNTVNTEKMMAAAAAEGHTLVSELEGCDAVVINTCGFIESAKQEAIETIFEVAQLKSEGKVGKLLVCGCLAERYQKDIAAELPEVDGFLGVGSFEAGYYLLSWGMTLAVLFVGVILFNRVEKTFMDTV